MTENRNEGRWLPTLTVGQQRIAVLPARECKPLATEHIRPEWSASLLWEARSSAPTRIVHAG